MEALLAKKLAVEVSLVVGDRGVFDVIADGECVYSKDDTGRFPRDEEVIEAIRSRM